MVKGGQIMSKLVNIETFRGYINKILPTVYEDSLSYYEVLCKVLEKMNEIINLDNQQNEIINNIPQSVDEFAEQLAEFKRDMNTDFNNFTTQINNDIDAFEAEVDTKIASDNVPTQGSNKLVKSGGVYASLQDIIDSLVKDIVPTQDSDNYVTSGGVYVAIQNAVTAINETIATKQNILTFDTTPTENSVNPIISGGVKTYVDNVVENVNNNLELYEETTDAILDRVTDDIIDLKNNKQNTLTFDSVPTSGSTNPVTSDGIYNAIQGATPTIDIDGAPTEGSTNAVSSGGTYNALVSLESDIDEKLDDKQDVLTFDVVPTQNSQNPVMSGGVWNAIAQVDPTGTIDPTPTQGSVAAVSSGGTWTALNTLESTLQGEINNKEDSLTFDNAPTINSGNPVTSDGIYRALQEKQSALTFDNAPTENSTNPVTSGGVYNALQGVIITTDATPTQGSINPVQSGGVYTALTGKQDTLTFDNTPTQNSTNPVTSSGIYTALAAKQDTLTFDNTPTQNSDNPVKSGGVYTALAGKQDTLTFDNTPTQNSTNPVTSGGVYNAIQSGGSYDTVLYQIVNRIYEGINLSEKFADEIEEYGDIGNWLLNRITDREFDGINIGDYIPVTCTNNFTFNARVAGIKTHNEKHIDFISKEGWLTTRYMNPVLFNNGTAQKSSAWLASDMYLYINSLSGTVASEAIAGGGTGTSVNYTTDGIYYYLPMWLKNTITQKTFSLFPSRYSQETLLTSDNGWYTHSIGKLWLPTETEITGMSVWSGTGYSNGGSVQYPLFERLNNRKLYTNNIATEWWTLSSREGNHSSFCTVNIDGVSRQRPATDTYSIPICFRVESAI